MTHRNLEHHAPAARSMSCVWAAMASSCCDASPVRKPVRVSAARRDDLVVSLTAGAGMLSYLLVLQLVVTSTRFPGLQHIQ